MNNVKCIRNCKKTGLVDCVCGFDNLFICENCGIENMHYYIETKFVRTHYMCCICRIETINDKTKEFREAYHLCEKKAPEPKQIKLL